MNLRKLIERLEEATESYGDDAEVRLMTQQNWPFENEIRGVTSRDEMLRCDPDEDEDGEPENIIYIVEGQQLGYGNEAAWEVCY